MAIIKLKELINILENHPDYKNKWEQGTPAKQSLVIEFDDDASNKIADTSEFTSTDGAEVIVDKNSKGLVKSIEIY